MSRFDATARLLPAPRSSLRLMQDRFTSISEQSKQDLEAENVLCADLAMIDQRNVCPARNIHAGSAALQTCHTLGHIHGAAWSQGGKLCSKQLKKCLICWVHHIRANWFAGYALKLYSRGRTQNFAMALVARRFQAFVARSELDSGASHESALLQVSYHLIRY
jgi:hypothetical protein